jgi:hypothetical protein
MVKTSIWTTYSRTLTWEEACVLARQWGDDLTTRLNFDHAWHTEYDYFDGRAWVGATNVDGEAIFVDGTAVRDRYPQGVYEYPPGFNSENSPGFSLGIQGLDGPERYGYLDEQTLQFGVLGPIPDQFVWETSGLTITGSPYRDWIQPADVSGMSIDLGAGADVISVEYDATAPAQIRMGAGDDSFSVGFHVEGQFEVWDGEGADAVSMDQGTVHAALDGDDDWYEAAKIIYDGATAPIHVNEKLIGIWYYPVISGSEIGTDQFSTSELHLGRGDDIVEDAVPIRLYTKGGNDRVEFGDYQWAAQAFVDGGDGNDTLVATIRGGRMVGGNGADVLALEDWLGVNKTEMTGGSGADTFRFGTVAQSNTAQAVINDFAANGAVQDTLDLTAFNLDAASASEAIGSGLISLTTVKGYTHLTVEGGAGAGDLTVMLKGIFGVNIVDNIVI